MDTSTLRRARPTDAVFDDDNADAYSVHSFELTAEQKLEPRSSKTLPLKGQSGRIQRRETRYIPLAKKHYEGYNVKAQEDLLAETYPVGLRKKRMWCVLFSIAVAGLLTIVTFAYLMWIFAQLDMRRDGSEAFQLKSDAVLFERPVHVEGTTFIGPLGQAEGAQNIEVDSTLSFSSNERMDVALYSPTTRYSANFSFNPEAVNLRSVAMTVAERASPDTPFVQWTDAQAIFSSDAVRFNTSKLVVEDPAILTAASVVAPPFEDLTIDSDEFLSMSSFTASTFSARFGGLRMGSTNGNVRVNASTEGFDFADLKMSRSGGQAVRIFVPVASLPKPVGPATAYKVCTCADGSLFLQAPNTACDDWQATLPADPCA